MNILNKLTLKNLKLNKKRTIVTIIGIALSCALICGVTTLIASFQEFLIDETKISSGDYHVMFKNIDKETISVIENNLKVKKSGNIRNLGFSELKESKNEYKRYLNVVGFDENMFNIFKINVILGRLPENENELVISEHISNNADVKYNVGDVIELKIGNRMYIDKKTNKEIILEENVVQEEGEYLKVNDTKKYKIVGVIERAIFEDFQASGYTVLTYADKNTSILNTKEIIDTAVSLKNPKDVYDFTNDISKDKIGSVINKTLLRYEGVSDNQNISNFMFTIGIFLIAVIMFASISVIRNSFNISIVERLKQFGMLSSIGATSKQIKKSVMVEGAIIGSIAVPIGIFAGVLGIGITLMFMNSLFKNIGLSASLHVVISLPAILISMLFIAITIFLSVRKPAKSASKVSPMEAILSSKDIAIKEKDVKISKISKKIFGIEGEIALKNLKRSKKKYRTTVFSIIVSIVIFISFSSFVDYGLKAGETLYQEMKYNVVVDYGTKDKKSRDELYNKIIKLNGIKEYTNERKYNIDLDEKYIDETYKNDFKNVVLNYDNKIQIPIKIYSINDEQYKKYVKEIGGNFEEYKDKGILINKNIINYNSKVYDTKSLNLKEGDSISIKNNDIKIAKITDKLPMNLSEYERYGGYLIVTEETIEKLNENNIDRSYSSLYIDSKDANKLEKQIIEIDSSLRNKIVNQDKAKQSTNSYVLIISIFFYGFIVVISLIGITNIFNTVTTNMSLRSTEFAILRAIGMTSKEFEKMINYESIFYGTKALLFGLPIGVIMSYVVRMVFDNIISTSLVFPTKAIIISIIFVFLIIFITMSYSTSKIKKQNIIETIRNENV